MSDESNKPTKPVTTSNQGNDWLKKKFANQGKRPSFIKPIQFHGSRHRG